MSRKRPRTESIEEKQDPNDIENKPPVKKPKLSKNNNESVKKKKQKFAKPYQCRVAAYLIGDFQSVNTGRLEFKALFGKNRLTIAWSDITGSAIRNAYDSFDYLSGCVQVSRLFRSMTTERVEINIDHIDSIKIDEGGAAIKLEIITNTPPIFTKQTNSGRGTGNKFVKSTDPTNGNAIKYKKHFIFIAKKPTAKNIEMLHMVTKIE